MNEIEQNIRKVIFESLPKPTPLGIIKCEASHDRIGRTGNYRISEDSEETADFHNILPRDFYSLIQQLYDASCTKSDANPWYRCNITVEGEKCTFHYWHEDPDISDLSLLEPNIDGSMPTFPFRNRFSIELLEQLRQPDFEPAFLEFVPRALSGGKSIPTKLLGYFALLDWQGDTFNGSFDQYFSRTYDYFGADLPRSTLYPEVRSTLVLLDLREAEELFDEAIALYSHFHQHVNNSRIVMGIQAVPKQTESDIMSRFLNLLNNMETTQWTYFGNHLSEFAMAE